MRAPDGEAGMTYNEQLAARLRRALSGRKAVGEIKMFGGLCFTWRGNMVCGILKDDLVLRVDKTLYPKLLKEQHARPMDFTKREMPGFLFVGPGGWKGAGLSKWIRRALDYSASLPPKA
jgi:hypothetical protein